MCGALAMTILLLAGIAGAATDVLYAHNGSDTISVIDTDTHAIKATIAVTEPGEMAEMAMLGRVYTTSGSGSQVTVIDTAYNTILTGYPEFPCDALVSNPYGNEQYMADYHGGTVGGRNSSGVATNLTVSVPYVVDLAMEDGSWLFAASTFDNSVAVISTGFNRIDATLPIEAPTDLAVNPAATTLLVASETTDNISVYSTTTDYSVPTTVSLITTWETSIATPSPRALEFSPDGSALYVVNGANGTVSVFETVGYTLMDMIAVGSDPSSISLSPDGSRAYVANRGSGTISVIDTASTQVVATITLPGGVSEVLCVLAPAATPFLPEVSGFSFANADGGIFTTAAFLETYGITTEVNFDDSDNVNARFYNDYFKSTGEEGACFGYAGAALSLFQQGTIAWGHAGSETVPEPWQNLGPLTGSNAPLTILDFARSYQVLQYDQAVINDLATYNDLAGNYDQLKQHLANNSPMVMCFTGSVWNETTQTWVDSGHAVVPYRIEENIYDQMATVFVYDPNQPCLSVFDTSNVPSLTIDLVNWRVLDYSNWHDIHDVQLVSAEAISAPAVIPTGVYSVEGFSGHLLFTDNAGRKLGEESNEIPGACPIGNYNALSGADGLRSYYVPAADNVEKKLIGDATGVAKVAMYAPNGLILAEAGVTPGSVDQFEILGQGTGVEFVSGAGTNSLVLTVSAEGMHAEQVVSVATSSIEAGGAMTVSDNGGVISVENQGLPRSCTLHLEQAGGEVSNTDDGIVIEVKSDSTILVEPTNWNDISKGVVVQFDDGSDGSIDTTQTIDTTPVLHINGISASVMSGTAPLTVEFVGDVSGAADKYSWKFGNSPTENVGVDTLRHTFEKPGEYPVTLKVKDREGHVVDEMTLMTTISVY